MLIKDDIRIDNIPHKKIIDVEKVYIDLLLEKVRLQRSKFDQITDKSFLLFLLFVAIGVAGYFFHYISQSAFQLLIIISGFFLIITFGLLIFNYRKQDSLIRELLEYVRK